MSKIIVSFPIEVPKEKYCYRYKYQSDICKYLNIELRVLKCDLGFHDLNKDKDGVIKSKQCLNLEKLYTKEIPKNQINDEVNHLSKIDDVVDFSIKYQHILLYKCTQMYFCYPEVSWVEAMQGAAIELSKQLKILENKLINMNLNKEKI